MSTAERHQGERQQSEPSRGVGTPSRSTTSAGPVAGSLLSLQRQAGNRAATLVVQRKEAASGGGGAGAGAKADSQTMEVLKGAWDNYVGSLIEKGIPPAKVIMLAGKLGMAFADGAGQALLEVRSRLGDQYDSDIEGSADRGDGLSDKQIAQLQNVRRWQANSVAELNGILEKGLVSMGKKAAEELASELVGIAFDKGLEKLTDAMSTKVTRYILDRVTGKWVDVSYLVREPVSGVREFTETLASDLTKAFLQSAASATTGAGWDRMAAVAAATEGGMSKEDAEKLADEAAKANLRSDDLAVSVEDKFAEVTRGRKWASGAEYAQVDRRTFAQAYPALVAVAKEYDELWFWQREARAAKKEQLRELFVQAQVALNNMNAGSGGAFAAEQTVLRSRFEKLAY